MSDTADESNQKGSIGKSIRRALKPKIIVEWTALLREIGFKGFIKKKGWKIVFTIFMFYLIRDSLLYLILPYFAAHGLLGC